jgi:nucleoside-diphosphate-sugar epimerase
MIHVDDLVDGIRLCGSRPEALGEVFLLGGSEAPTLWEITATVADIARIPPPRASIPVWPVYAAGWLCEKICVPLGIDPPLHRRRVSFFTHNREFDIGKARRLLGFNPRVSVREGIERTIRWYVARGLMSCFALFGRAESLAYWPVA